jgi:hypothetical protein
MFVLCGGSNVCLGVGSHSGDLRLAMEEPPLIFYRNIIEKVTGPQANN